MILKVAVAATATLVQAAMPRRWFLLQNLSDTDIFVAFEGTSDVTTPEGASPGFRLKANGGAIGNSELNASRESNDKSIYAIHGGTGPKTLVLQTY